jgi:hypothetical protein
MISCNRLNKDAMHDKEEYMFVVIENMTNEPVYIDDRFKILGIDFSGQEKIYYFSHPIYYKDIYDHMHGDFINMLSAFTKKEIPIKKVHIDFSRFYYELNDKITLDKIYDGECDKILFRLFYTREPVNFYGYKNYAEGIKKYGYYIDGHQEDNKLIFNITSFEKVTDDRITRTRKSDTEFP